MAVHALTPLMKSRKQASAYDLFDESVEIAGKLVARVEAVAKNKNAPPRDELLDMGVHALSALLNGRQPEKVENLLDECMEVARMLIVKVDEALAEDVGESKREELLDMAVHVQTALLTSRPKMSADELSDQCVAIARKLIAKVDREVA
jgi:hypothetical protein